MTASDGGGQLGAGSMAVQMLLQQFSTPLVAREVEIPELSRGQTLVRIEAAGVCGSDVHMWEGNDPRTPIPIALGHEGIGRVEQLHDESPPDINGRKLSVGDRIIWNRGVVCGRCHACAVLREPSLCTRRWVYGIHRSAEDPPYLNGCYASHVILDPNTDVLSLSKDVAPEVMVAATCSGATAAHVFEYAQVQVGHVVVILGPGPLGAFCAAFARAQGAREVVMVGSARSDWRMELCRKLGATGKLVLDDTSAQQRRQAVDDLTEGRGADLVIEAAGAPTATSEALELARIGGQVAIVGYGEPRGSIPLLPFEHIVRKNLRVQGVWVSDARHLRRAVDLVLGDPQSFRQLVTHRVPLEEANEALDLVRQRKAMKAVLVPELRDAGRAD